jgi:hypothetical protein
VAEQEPEAGLTTVAQLPPHQMQTALGGVDGSVNRTVGDERTGVQQSPPTMMRPVGAPQTLHGQPTVAAPGQYTKDKVEKIAAAHPGETPKVEGGEEPKGDNPGDQVKTPGFLDVAGAIWNMITGSISGKVTSALNSLPNRDPALNTTVGTPGKVPLKDDTDPALADKQVKNLDNKKTELHSAGRDDAAKQMGEHQIFPDVPHQVLRARVEGGAAPGGAVAGRRPVAAGGPGGAGGPGTVPPTALSAVAQQERGPQIQAGFAQGQGQMGTERKTKETASDQAQQQHDQDVADAVAENTDAQAGERTQALNDVTVARVRWRDEQDAQVADLDDKKGVHYRTARTEITKQQTDTDKQVATETTNHNTQIDTERTKAETDATNKREDSKKDSGNWFSRALTWIKDKFIELKNAIVKVFDEARKAVTRIIKTFKDLAFKLIDTARKAIIAAINIAADALILLGDVALAAFPGLRDKWRNFINDKRDKAINKVNEYADKLKKKVGDFLDKLGNALIAALNLLEKGLLAAVKLVESVVVGALKFVEALVNLVGEFAALIADIAPNPIGWLKSLGSAAKEGVQKFLWGALKSAVKKWFNEKVESVLGLGKMLWNVLIKGCLSIGQIGKMAWQAVIAALPMMIVMLVIEKLVSLIVPAAGAIMTIIQGLMAAWGTISKIIAAFKAFFAFLKAVKAGGVTAACLFAVAVAAGAVALLDFIANFLLMRLGKALKGVSGRLKGLAQKVMKGLKRGAKGAKKAAGRAVNAARNGLKRGADAVRRGVQRGANAVRRGVGRARGRLRGAAASARNALRRTGQAVKSGLRRVGQGLRRVGSRLARTKVGRALANGARRAKDFFRRQRDRFRDWRQRHKDRKRENDKKKHPESKDARLARIIARIKPRIQGLAHRGARRRILGAVLWGMRAWYRLKELEVVGSPARNIRAGLSPGENFLPLDEVELNLLLQILREEVERETRTPGHQEISRLVTSERMSPHEVDLEGYRLRKNVEPKIPKIVSRITVPNRVSPLALATGFNRLISERRVARARMVFLGNERNIAFVSMRVTSGDAAGRWRPMVQDRRTGLWRPDESVPLDYPGFADAAAENPHELMRGLRLARSADYDALSRLPDGGRLAAQTSMVPLAAEAMRGPYAAVTSPASMELAEGSLRRHPAGVPLPEVYRTMPYSQPGSVGSSRVMEWRERRAAGEQVRPREPWFRQRPGGESPNGLRNRVVDTLRAFLVVEGIVTEEGLRNMTQEKFRDLVRRTLRNPEMRRRLFGIML